ncbi:hypothetical protein BDP27DRAFT_1374768 [Rhodocollybia butyracea]|uniref:Uncharacterized protein n=1 Tax=Rhodocollybia butyracea TaxID=206335 RepID=A0A9P5P4V7_9AGAR|nr:hypothetical protein BDP27DRAFT_1374768 [Rhodocollybia butyracea]
MEQGKWRDGKVTETPLYHREFETRITHTNQWDYSSPEYRSKFVANSSSVPSTDRASSFPIQYHGDSREITGKYGTFERGSSREHSVNHLGSWGAPNGSQYYHGDYEVRLSNDPWKSGFSHNCQDFEPPSFANHNEWPPSSQSGASSSAENYYVPGYIPSTPSISPVMNIPHYNSTSLLTGDSPQPFCAPFRKTNFYDPVRDVHDNPPDNIKSMDFDSSSAVHSVQSSMPTQSLPFKDDLVNITGALVSPPSVNTPPVTPGDALHLSKSSGLPNPSTLTSASLLSAGSTGNPTLPNLEGPALSPSHAVSVIETESSVDKFRHGSPLTSNSPLSMRLFTPPVLDSDYRPPNYPVEPCYCSAVVFEPLDFTAEVLGSHVGDQAEIQVWPNGWKTVLPELRRNILEADAKAVKWMANPTNVALFEQSIVHYLDSKSYDGDPATLVKDVCSLMAKSFIVVLSNAVSPVGPRRVNKLEDITYVLGAGSSQAQAITYHDMELRARDPGQPYVHGTLPMFLDNITKPDQIHMLLDFPVAIETIPHPFHLLNDGKISAEQMNSDMCYRVRNTAGYAVGGQVAGDRNDPQPKIWAVLSLKDPSMVKIPLEQLAEKFQDVTSMVASSTGQYNQWLKGVKKAQKNIKKVPLFPTQGPDTWSEVWNVELIYLRPGDIFISHRVLSQTKYTSAPMKRLNRCFLRYRGIRNGVSREVTIFVAGHYLGIPLGKKKLTEDMLVDFLYDGNTDYKDPGAPFTLGTLLSEETRKIFAQQEKRDRKKKVPKAKK